MSDDAAGQPNFADGLLTGKVTAIIGASASASARASDRPRRRGRSLSLRLPTSRIRRALCPECMRRPRTRCTIAIA